MQEVCGQGGSRRRFPPRVGLPRPALDTLNGLPLRNFSRQIFPLRRCQRMTQNLRAVVDGMQELGYSTTRRGPGRVVEKVRSLPRLAEGAGASACPKPSRRRCCACVRACPLRLGTESREGEGLALRAGRGLAGRGREAVAAAARARAGANGDRREGRGGPGGGDDRRRRWPRRRAAAGWGRRRAPRAREARRWPRAWQFIGGRTVARPASFGRARRRCPSWTRCGSGWASTTRRWVRAPVGAGEATRREPGAATGLAGLRPPLPPARHEGQQRQAPGPPRPRRPLSVPARPGLHRALGARPLGVPAPRARAPAHLGVQEHLELSKPEGVNLFC